MNLMVVRIFVNFVSFHFFSVECDVSDGFLKYDLHDMESMFSYFYLVIKYLSM